MEKNIKIGFKALKKGLINKFGEAYELNKIYSENEQIAFGKNKPLSVNKEVIYSGGV